MSIENKLDEVYIDTWDTRKERLRGKTYTQYLQSNHWQDVKNKAESRPNYKKCEFCSSKQVELHHTTYKWMYTVNELRAIVSLCRKHHQEIHDLAKTTNVSVRVATNKLRKIYKPDFYTKNRI